MSRLFSTSNWVLIDKRAPDLNKKNRSLVGHIRWTLHGKRKINHRKGSNSWALTPKYKRYALKHQLYIMGRVHRGAGNLWPHPDSDFIFNHNIKSLWLTPKHR